MGKKVLGVLGGIAVLSLVGACGGNLPLQIVDSSIPPAGRSYQSVGQVAGKSCQQSVFGFAISDGGRTYDAYKAALAAAPGADALIDVASDVSVYTIYPWSRICVHVTGEAVTYRAS